MKVAILLFFLGVWTAFRMIFIHPEYVTKFGEWYLVLIPVAFFTGAWFRWRAKNGNI